MIYNLKYFCFTDSTYMQAVFHFACIITLVFFSYFYLTKILYFFGFYVLLNIIFYFGLFFKAPDELGKFV